MFLVLKVYSVLRLPASSWNLISRAMRERRESLTCSLTFPDLGWLLVNVFLKNAGIVDHV